MGDAVQVLTGLLVGKDHSGQGGPVQHALLHHAGEPAIDHPQHGAVLTQQPGIDPVGVQHQGTPGLQPLGEQALAAARPPGDADDRSAFAAVHALKARRLAQAVHRSGVGAADPGALGQDAPCLGVVEPPQKGKQPPGVLGVVPAHAQGVHQPGPAGLEQGQIFLKAEDARAGPVHFRQNGGEGVPGRSLEQGDRGLWGVMAVFHARGAGLFTVGQAPVYRAVGGRAAHGGGDHLLGDGAGAQDLGIGAGHVHHGGFHSHRAGAAVHDGGDLALHVVQHVPGVGGRGLARGVGRGRGQGHPRRVDDGPGHRVGGHTDAHGVQPGGGPAGNGGGFFHHHCQRAGPEVLRHPVNARGHLRGQGVQLLQPGDVDDEGIVLRAALGLEDAQHRLPVQGVGCQAVDRFRGDGHHLPRRQQRTGPPDPGGGGPQKLSFHICRSNGYHSCPWPAG